MRAVNLIPAEQRSGGVTGIDAGKSQGAAYVVLGLLEVNGPGTPYDLKRWVDESIGYFWSFPRAQLYVEPERLARGAPLNAQRSAFPGTGVGFVRAARAVRAALDQRHRYAHVLRVARMAEALARAHGADPLQARTAGLLHDLARLYPAERLLRECAERGMAIDAFERAQPVVLHARLGAEEAGRQGASDRVVFLIAGHHSPPQSDDARLLARADHEALP